MKELQSLREALHSIPDPRTAKGRQSPLWTVLCVVALGLLSGCVHLSEIVRLGQRLSWRNVEEFHRELSRFVVP